MPQNTTLEYIADLVIRRAIAEMGRGPDLVLALERVYPFTDSGRGREVWEKALERHNVKRTGMREERRADRRESASI
jgi:hypothetical protein